MVTLKRIRTGFGHISNMLASQKDTFIVSSIQAVGLTPTILSAPTAANTNSKVSRVKIVSEIERSAPFLKGFLSGLAERETDVISLGDRRLLRNSSKLIDDLATKVERLEKQLEASK